jgi:hypothetical protein
VAPVCAWRPFEVSWELTAVRSPALRLQLAKLNGGPSNLPDRMCALFAHAQSGAWLGNLRMITPQASPACTPGRPVRARACSATPSRSKERRVGASPGQPSAAGAASPKQEPQAPQGDANQEPQAPQPPSDLDRQRSGCPPWGELQRLTLEATDLRLAGRAPPGVPDFTVACFGEIWDGPQTPARGQRSVAQQPETPAHGHVDSPQSRPSARSPILGMPGQSPPQPQESQEPESPQQPDSPKQPGSPEPDSPKQPGSPEPESPGPGPAPGQVVLAYLGFDTELPLRPAGAVTMGTPRERKAVDPAGMARDYGGIEPVSSPVRH